MDGASSPSAGGDGASAMEEPDEVWVEEHLEVERHEEHGGVEVMVRDLALNGAAVDVAKTGAWLHTHADEVREFIADFGACCTRNGHGAWGVCWCHAEPGVVWMLCVWLVACVCVCVRSLRIEHAPAHAGTRPGSMHGTDTAGSRWYVCVLAGGTPHACEY